ncbi:hypothetical protein PP677_003819 [Salmonella enterica]|nr:hypothetical protein [Salmonella enterica]EIV1999672.1 hypothetical protein [Salmonella enterica subsp. enterica serovar Telelkebir]EHH9729268.1 hypothetical protein [Salmonella enterica]EKL0001528.1 hypothetical protein [Salmonella enterica]EKO9615851.1 hypothetical protein [Salmonella enterica]
MDKDHLPLLEDQNPVRRSEIFAGTGSAKVALTEAIKSLSNVSGRDIAVLGMVKNQSSVERSLNSFRLFLRTHSALSVLAQT